MTSRRLFMAACLAGAMAPSWAWAHATLTASSPAQGGTAAASGFVIELRFNGRTDAARSRATLTLADGTTRAVSFRPGENPASLVAEEKAVPPGPCILAYTALSVDGHLTTGSLRFTAVEP